MQLRPLLLAAACAALAACNQGGGNESASEPAASAPAAAVPKDPEAIKAALAALPAPYNAADIENGRKKFGLCRSCHTIEPGAPNMTGPNLHGVFGRKAASVEGYNYSDALKASNIVWSPEPLDQWLAKPQEFLPGNKMTFVGLKEPKDRTDLIAYLMVESGYKAQ
ncbi:cytochrome c family protein [Phenylobacterium sp.]|jgi:cytochrome c|uniref:c-type cytochrome n=1 Tax=Phenylobacterium sp. TaxID=1871053 RepID=UPI002E2F176B|nr:cytochrome c family protein [Phenylobacterium sp.]HEX2561101.1 cytochrome c family protein [Phenylobacterium sp.]